jgi:exonuclease SbcC
MLSDLRGQYDDVVDEGTWYSKRAEQLKAEPAEVRAADAKLAAVRVERDRLRSELAAAEAARVQLVALGRELEAEKTRARTLAGEIAAIPEGYDSERHSEVRSGLERLRELEKKIARLEARLEAGPRLKAKQAEAAEEARQIDARIGELEKSRHELGFSEGEFATARTEYEAARGALEGARLGAERARADLDAARQLTETARRKAEEQRRVSRLIGEREADQRLHNELDLALVALRDELNDRVRPELSEIASEFLAELTDGRYNQIEIGIDYDIVVLDAGEEKPVISGGEEDIANLVLRLAISQMVADRAGQTLSLLVFDEVFGGLDDQRREGVVQLLQRLQDRFEQVLLITHIESIREGMDQVVRVEYDERSGASVLLEESPDASDESFEPEELAALLTE